MLKAKNPDTEAQRGNINQTNLQHGRNNVCVVTAARSQRGYLNEWRRYPSGSDVVAC